MSLSARLSLLGAVCILASGCAAPENQTAAAVLARETPGLAGSNTVAPLPEVDRSVRAVVPAAAIPAQPPVVVHAPALHRTSRRGGRGNGVLVWPADGQLTGWFGEPRNSHMHAGLDIDGETGDPVYAAGPGVVAHAGGSPEGMGGYGNTILIDHGKGAFTVYAHLSAIGVQPGQAVQRSAVIGAVGNTGASMGSHLHFELRIDGRPVDPLPLLQQS